MHPEVGDADLPDLCLFADRNAASGRFMGAKKGQCGRDCCKLWLDAAANRKLSLCH